MAEVFGTAAAALGLSVTALSGIVQLCDYIKRYKSAETDMAAIAKYLKSLQVWLDYLLAWLERVLAADVNIEALKELNLKGEIDEFNETCRRFHEDIENWATFRDSKIRRARQKADFAVLKKGEVSKFKERIDEHRHVVGLALQVLSSTAGIETHAMALEQQERQRLAMEPRDPAGVCDYALRRFDSVMDRERLIASMGIKIPGTCEWIIQDAMYQSWAQEDSRLLWICGSAGKGKTMLSIFMSEQLEILSQCTADRMTLFFFCTYKKAERSNAASIISGLLQMLLAKRPDLADDLATHFDSPSRAQATLREPDILWKLFISAIERSKIDTVYCLLDGLDECDDSSRRWIAARIMQTTTEAKVIKFVVVSQHIMQFRTRVTPIDLDLEHDSHTKGDIQKYISARVGELRLLGPERQRLVEQQLFERSENTFLWAALALEELRTKETASEIDKALRSLPPGLTAWYERIIQRIEDREFHQDCVNILRWLACTLQPLLVSELATIFQYPSTVFVSSEQAVRDRLTMCDALVKMFGDEVHLIHQSAREFLWACSLPDDKGAKRLFIQPNSVHAEIAQACLHCLENSKLDEAPLDESKHDVFAMTNFVRRRGGFCSYAINNWFKHAAYSRAVTAQVMLHPTGILKKKSVLRDAWWRVYRRLQSLVADDNLPALHLACFLGIEPWARALMDRERCKLKRHRSLHHVDSEGRSPLHLAAREDRATIAERLLVRGARIDARDADGCTALFEAVAAGAEATARVLIQNGANVNTARISTGFTALHDAAQGGRVNLMLLLLSNGASLESTSVLGRTPLHAAVFAQEMAAVRVLLDAGANVNARDSQFGIAALHQAAVKGNTNLIRLLLDRGADIDLRTDYNGTAVQEAALKDQWAAMQLLIDRGATLDARDHEWVNSSRQRQQEAQSAAGATAVVDAAGSP